MAHLISSHLYHHTLKYSHQPTLATTMPSFVNKLQSLCSRIARSSKSASRKGFSSRSSMQSFYEISEADFPTEGLYASSSCDSSFYEVSYIDLGSKYIPGSSDSVSYTETTLASSNKPDSPSVRSEVFSDDMSDTLCEVPTNVSSSCIANLVEFESSDSLHSIYMKFPLPPVEIPVKPLVYALPPTRPLNIVKKSKANPTVPVSPLYSSPTDVVFPPTKPLNIIKRAKKANVDVNVQQQSTTDCMCNMDWSKVESADARFPAVATVAVAASSKKACADSRRSRRDSEDSLDFIMHDLDGDLAFAIRLDTFVGYTRTVPRTLRPTCSPHPAN